MILSILDRNENSAVFKHFCKYGSFFLQCSTVHEIKLVEQSIFSTLDPLVDVASNEID